MATIFVAGDYWAAEECCRKFCDEIGLCVTIEATRYVYTGDAENGVRIGLINYGRFPASPDEIFAKAEALANRLLDWLEMDSVSIVATDRTVWLSKRPDDPTYPPLARTGDTEMSHHQPTAKEQRRWLARARTILWKAENLQGEMLSALGETHVWTDYGDNVMCEAESLVGLLESGRDKRHA